MGDFPERLSKSARSVRTYGEAVVALASDLLRLLRTGRNSRRTEARGPMRARSPREALEARVAHLEARVAELERQADREMQDYLRREAEAFALVADLPKPPDYGTDDPWEIARLGLKDLSRADIDRLFEED